MKKLAVIAHDGKKAEMVAFLKDHWHLLDQATLVQLAPQEAMLKELA